MTASLPSLASTASPKNRQRYLAALQHPADEPVGWLVTEPLVDFDHARVLSAVNEGELTQAQCLSAICAASKLDSNQQANQFQQFETLIAACEKAQLPTLNEQLMLAELPITLLHKFEEDAAAQRLGEAAMELLGQRVQEVLDDDGWPGIIVVEEFGALAASWVRCAALLEAVDWELDQDAESTLRWLPRQIMRLKRKDDTLLLSDSPAKVPDDMLRLLISILGDGDDEVIFLRTIDRPDAIRPNLTILDKSRNTISSWGESLLFHDGWERKSCKLALRFGQQGCHIEIAKSKTLIAGNVFPEIIVDGNPLTPIQEPDLLVEYIEGRVAFAELEWQFENGVIMQRQILLSMEDKFAWIGDAILADGADGTDGTDGAVDIEYSCRWKLADGVSTVAEAETSEGYFYDGKKMRGLIIPPAFNEWKSGQGIGKLELAENSFTLSAKRRGKSLYMPVFLDLSPKRCLKPRTWRQLTVAESLEIVGPDVAVAYRVQVGKKQFVFYRSIAEPKNRTFLGENVSTEMFLGRLEKDSSMTELVQIE